MQKIWIVEDDDNIREIVEYSLASSGYETQGFIDAISLEKRLQENLPDLLLLDIMLPGEDGMSILKRLKQARLTCDLPIIMLTAKGSELDRVKGLDLGADDYLAKPFSVLELTSRIRAVLRRTAKDKHDHVLLVSDIRLDTDRRTVTVQEKDITLTFKEFELLHYLMLNKGLVLARDQIMERVWGFDYEGESRTLDMHILSLRQKLGASGSGLKTVRSVGYKLEDLS